MIIKKATEETLRYGADLINNGGLIAFPTETVYGLGADGFNARAVARIYTAKARPTDNPLILHVLNTEALETLTSALREYVRLLTAAFWPGPLTLVCEKHPCLPAWIGGHPEGRTATLAVRSPSHEIARALLSHVRNPVMAPSANKSGKPSPTEASHVAEDFTYNEIDCLLDGGRVSGGLESTVVDVTGPVPVILRPGAITGEMIEAVIGLPVKGLSMEADFLGAAPRSPGMKYRHYAPQAPMVVVTGPPETAAARITKKILSAEKDSAGWGILATTQTVAFYRAHLGERAVFDPPEGTVPAPGQDVVILTAGDRTTLSTIAGRLYGCLRRFNAYNLKEIYAEGVTATGLGQAIMNRMVKAAGGNVW